jgi:phage-related baseplate assembly protein
MAPESFSVAGPYGAYEYWAATANSNISNISVWSNAANAGKVYIYFLMENGRLPTAEEIQQVYDICSADDIRPLTDQVFVEVPAIVVVLVLASFWIEDTKVAFADDIRTKAYAAWEDYRIWQSEEIGRDVNPSKLVEMLMDAGVKRVVIDSPSFTDPNNIINQQSVANLDPASTLTYGGLETKVVEDFQLGV